MKRVYLKTFGCRVNQSETEALRRELGDAEDCADFERADVCILNTCTVTEEADKDALRLLRRISRRNPSARVLVTGCLATRAAAEIAAACPGAVVVPNGRKGSVAELVGSGEAASRASGRARASEPRSRASIKVQDGCRHGCSYCIVPSVRSELRSKPLPEVEAELERLLDEGYREIVLCGIRLGSYRDGETDFVGLLARLTSIPGDFRLRLSSLEITDVDDAFFRLIGRAGERLCPSFHLPLQSGSNEVLRRMRRWYTAEEYLRRMARLKARLPQGGYFTDVMVGFPGETEPDFEDSMRVIREAGLNGLHIFRFCARPGTDAAGYPGRLDEAELLSRMERMRALDRELRSAFEAAAVGSRRRVLVETRGWCMTDHFLRVRLSRDPGPGLHWAAISRDCEGTLSASVE